jgi:phytoene synthase
MLDFVKANLTADAWSEARWRRLERALRCQAMRATSDTEACHIITRRARQVLRAYSTSFFLVTRFLPPAKRARVELIYAAVRYPDEIVDTFPLTASEKAWRLDEWAAHYETALAASSIQAALAANVPCFVAGFADVVRKAAIPPEHYRAFIEAMRRDSDPRPFATLDDLIESYIYGSAIVVGYFLTYVYGASHAWSFNRALESARSLGIALQLTNFLRDVREDERRGRVYLPQDLLRGEGIYTLDSDDPRQHDALNRVLRRLSAVAESYYAAALADIDAFAADSRTAIRACIDVYRQLNQRIGHSPRGLLARESVPMGDKLRVLPPSKYWRLPLAYLFEW